MKETKKEKAMKNYLLAFLLTAQALIIMVVIGCIFGDFSIERLTFYISFYALYNSFYNKLKK